MKEEIEVVANLNCSECHNPKFFILQIENDLYTLCLKCGHIAILHDIIGELKLAKKELKP
jgi:hypothetical protein